MGKEELIEMMNKALALEHAARIQYMTHASRVKNSPNSESLIARFKEIAEDEREHEELFRECIVILGGKPTYDVAERHDAESNEKMLEVNLKDELDAVEYYKQIEKKLIEMKEELKYEFEYVEFRLKKIIMDEQEHALELKSLM